MPTMVVVLVLALIKGVQTFDEIYRAHRRRPRLRRPRLIVQYIYETGFADQPQLFGLAAAASILLAVVLLVLTLVQLWRQPAERRWLERSQRAGVVGFLTRTRGAHSACTGPTG